MGAMPKGAGGQAAISPADMKIGEYISGAIELFKRDPGNWIVIGLVGYVALGVGFWGGFQNCTLKALRGEKPEIGDVLAPFSKIGDYIVPMIIIYVGFMLCFIPGLLFATWWFFAYPMIAERGVSWKEATDASKAVASQSLVQVLIVSFVAGVLGSLLYFITAPLMGMIQVLAYQHVFYGRTGVPPQK